MPRSIGFVIQSTSTVNSVASHPLAENTEDLLDVVLDTPSSSDHPEGRTGDEGILFLSDANVKNCTSRLLDKLKCPIIIVSSVCYSLALLLIALLCRAYSFFANLIHIELQLSNAAFGFAPLRRGALPALHRPNTCCIHTPLTLKLHSFQDHVETMTFVKLLVEDEFVDEESILHSDLDYFAFLNEASTVDFLRESLKHVQPPTNDQVIEQPLLYKDGNKSTFKKIAISALQAFVAKNWFLHDEEVSENLVNWLDSFFPKASEYLGLSVECLERSIRFLNLLCLCKFVLSKEEGASIWKLRYIMVHQMIDPVPSTSLYLEAKRTHLAFEGFLTDEPKNMRAKLLKIQVAVELASCLLLYNDVGSAKPLIDNVREFCDLKIDFSGALGLRTHFQEKATSQLYVKLTREAPLPPGSTLVKGKPLIPDHPKNVALQHETLLNKVNFLNEIHTESGAAIFEEEELLLLAVACLMKRNGIYSDEIASEEILTLLDFIVDNTAIWVVRYESLYLRCHVEGKNAKKVERSMVQLNALADSISELPSKPCSLPRGKLLQQHLNYFYAVCMHSNYDVKISLAESLTSLGCIKSALDIYQELHAWEQMVSCFHR